MAAPPIRLGLVGAGRWGQRYIQTINRLSEVTLARLGSTNPASTDLVPRDCHISQDWREVASATDLDGIIIATPPVLHCEMALMAVRAGLPVLVEKPLTLDRREAEILATEAEALGAAVMVGHTHLFSEAFRTLKARQPSLGPVRSIRALAGSWGPFRPDVQPVWDWGAHDVTMCLDLVSGPASVVSVRRHAGGRLDGGWADDITLDLAFPNHVSARIRIGNLLAQKQRRFRVECANGWLEYDDLADHKLVEGRIGETRGTAIALRPILPLDTVVREFAPHAISSQRSHAGLSQGVTCVTLLEQAHHLLQTHSIQPMPLKGYRAVELPL
jgi:predicted dehydrogenase